MRDGALAPDFEDEIVAGTCVVREGTVVHGPTAEALGEGTPVAPPTATPSEPPTSAPPPSETELPS
jgi:NAD(P) transhydrogenase subunit alpha